MEVVDARPFPTALVVVADDDRATCDHIARLLRARGLEVVPVDGGQKAVDAVRARSVDLLVLDVGMPGLGGIDACRVVKTIAEDRFLPVILLAGGRRKKCHALSGGQVQAFYPFGDLTAKDP